MDKLLVMIFHDRSIDEEVREVLRGLGLERYSQVQDTVGVGENGPHLGTAVWPSLNHITLVVIEGGQREAVLGGVRAMQREFPFIGLRALLTPVLEMV